MPPEPLPPSAAYFRAGSLLKWLSLQCQAGAECLFTHRGRLSGRHEWGGRVGDRPCIVLTFPQAAPTGGTAPQMPSLLHCATTENKRTNDP